MLYSRAVILKGYKYCKRKRRPSLRKSNSPCLPVQLQSAEFNSTAAEFLNNRLRKGGALGNVVFKSSNGIMFKCTKDCIGGRGLRVYQSVAKGVTIARGDGTLVQYNDLNNVPSTADFKIWDSRNKILHLHEPTIHSPANLANTSDGTAKNNCRIKHRIGSSYFSIETLTSLQPGDEVTVAYGSKFTKNVRATAQLEDIARKKRKAVSTSLISCDKCHVLIVAHRMRYHRGRIGCRMQQHKLEQLHKSIN